MELFEQYQNIGSDLNYDTAATHAAQNGHVSIMKQMIQCYIDKVNNNPPPFESSSAYASKIGVKNHMILALYSAILQFASERNYESIIEYIIDEAKKITSDANWLQSFDVYNWMAIYAAKGGHLTLIQNCIKLGADRFDMIMTNAADHGHLSVVLYCINNNPTNVDYGMNYYNNSLIEAASSGHMDIVKMLIITMKFNGNEINYTDAVRYACGNGHWSIAKYCIGLIRGTAELAVAIGLSLTAAAEGGYIDIFNKLVKMAQKMKIHVDYNEAMAEESSMGHRNIVLRCLDLGADDYDWSTSNANENNRIEIVQYLESL
jgi:hypothetical protein